MNTNYIIFEDNVHAQVFFVQAINREQAWKLYLEHEWDYVEQRDGTYCHKPLFHNTLQDVFDTYGIIPHTDGTYSNTNNFTFRSLEDLKATYGVEEQTDRTFISHDRCYSDLAEAMDHVIEQCHIEIAECNINLQMVFQLLFSSKDKWDYIESATAEDIKTDIVNEHRWQARRYESLNKLQEAITELKKALHLAENCEVVSFRLDIAHLLSELNQFSEAAKQYRQALKISTVYDDQDQIRYRLAQVYESLGEHSKALWHYRRILKNDLFTENRAELEKRIVNLKTILY